MRPALRVATVLALAATLAGCGGRLADRASTPPATSAAGSTSSAATSSTATTATNGTTAPATTTATDAAGQVVDQESLDEITGVLDETENVLDAVDQEIAADPQE